ncbi:BirA family biotin operon repressor/biotin-[acetyl-CoA-carboxylase] ligase [Actinomadura pelletieri DSM 43383]|uniref:biotin--[biotin carboxyl-carrier protein] ligase n=1 Tax=Actinomadura pelletieri DSM 43383 TaxID=1120940 RepID=A0A495QS24_9ACTN|nr:biotin--[acetyl-CoA-carboxylase] ligase [Actinomadura pelletieri]RKS76310.1 BirA family biotin operon repressor/biotin-[acetyl-CoA-carboxylase] ligase [Actinomadura pelletieri DSM 43383]
MSESPFSDLGRPPLREAALERALVRDGGLWREVRVVDETGSTNADLAVRAREGAVEGTVLVAESQTAGRGRLGRAWAAPPRSGLMFSMLVRPRVPVPMLGWASLLTGVAVASAVRRMTAWSEAGEGFLGDGGDVAVDVRLKWPNDLLVGDRKLAGILVEKVEDGLVVGVGLNVGLREEELPVATATSLAIEGAPLTDRAPLLRAILREFATWYQEWTALDGDPESSGLRTAYKNLCVTLGREVRVELPGEMRVAGTARDVDGAGRLVVSGPGGDTAISAGDVVHVR